MQRLYKVENDMLGIQRLELEVRIDANTGYLGWPLQHIHQLLETFFFSYLICLLLETMLRRLEDHTGFSDDWRHIDFLQGQGSEDFKMLRPFFVALRKCPGSGYLLQKQANWGEEFWCAATGTSGDYGLYSWCHTGYIVGFAVMSSICF